MSDPDKPMDEPKLGKNRRRSAVIDLKAEEVTTSGEAAVEAVDTVSQGGQSEPTGATETPAATASSEPTPTDAADSAAPEAPASPTTPETDRRAPDASAAEAAPAVEPLHVPPAPEARKPSLALPMIAAAGLGLIFGGVGGVVAPSLMGGNEADAARIAILDRTQQQLVKDQAALASAAELEKVRQSVAKLEAAAAQRGEASAPAAAPAAAPALEGRIADIEAGLKALSARPSSGGGSAAPVVDLTPLREQIAALQARFSEIDGRTRNLGAAETQRRELQAQAASLEGQVKALDAAIKDLTGRIEAVSKAAEAAPRAAAQTVSAAVDPKIAAIGQRVEQAEARLEAGRAAPLFAAVQALAQTFHRGSPYATELTAAEALGAPAEQLQALRPFAERGAPTPQRLQETFAPLAGKLAGDGSQPGVMGYVSRFVTVRPTEESAGGAPAAIVGSIEAALRRGDVAAAVANWNRLPEQARSASAEWGEQATRRAAAAKSLAEMQAAATTALRK